MSHSYSDTQLLIDGQWQDAASGRKIPVRNPASGEVIGHVAHADVADLDRALPCAVPQPCSRTGPTRSPPC